MTRAEDITRIIVRDGGVEKSLSQVVEGIDDLVARLRRLEDAATGGVAKTVQQAAKEAGAKL